MKVVRTQLMYYNLEDFKQIIEYGTDFGLQENGNPRNYPKEYRIDMTQPRLLKERILIADLNSDYISGNHEFITAIRKHHNFATV